MSFTSQIQSLNRYYPYTSVV